MTDGAPTKKAAGSPFGIDRLIRGMALTGGFIVLGVAVMTVFSVVGRYTISLPVTGDYEIVEYGISIAAFFFLGFTHLSDGHLITEFFSTRMSERTTRNLDRIQNVILLAVLGLLIWRVVIGGFDKFETGDESMFLRMKVWWLHVVGFLGLILFAWVALRKIFRRPGD